MARYSSRFRLLPLAALLCVGSCMSTEGYYRYQDGGPSGAAGDGTPGSGGDTGNGGSGGSTGAAGVAGNTATGTAGRGGTTGSAGSAAGRGGTTGAAGRGGTTGAAGRGGTTGAAGSVGGVLLVENFDPPQTMWPLDYAVLTMHSFVTDGAQAQVLNLTEAEGDQALAAAGPNSWTNISLEAKVKVLSFSGTSSSDGVAICVRLGGPDLFYYFAIQASDGKGKIKINNKAAGGSNTSLSSSLDIGFVMNTWMTLRFDVVGTTLTAYVNGAQKGTFTVADSGQMLPMGGIGFMVQRATAQFDDITVRSLP